MYPTEASINDAFAEVTNEEVKEQLIDLTINLAASPGLISPEEVGVINHMCKIWEYTHKLNEDK
ncbi:hypothetical protein ES705_33122 [subsurface metagenome]